ncbi:MAG: DRTGG domain-containing protein [Anaerolineae bacterium]|jgi:hypothetical protein|nr:DRTGG domain-containing protein [Anaerolineae bacterium]
MKLEEIVKAVSGEMLVPPAREIEVLQAFAADLMSDVLMLAEPQMLMITGMVNAQTIRTAEMADIPAIVFVRGKRPPEEMLELAKETGIGVVLSPYTMYETSGLLYVAGLSGLGKVPVVQQR